MKQRLSLFVFLLFALSACSHRPPPTTFQEVDPSVRKVEIVPQSQVEAKGKKFMVSTQGKASTQAALQVLKSGGNLIDAAVAASLSISVERPQSTGIGGGGFLIYHEAATGKNFVFDFRERAPKAAFRDQFLNKKGDVVEKLSLTGGLSVGVPGLIRGLSTIHKRFGKKTWSSLVSPAIQLAEKGFPLYPYLQRAIDEEKEDLSKFADSKKIFLSGSKILKQPDLAKTLRTLAKNPEDFYTGRIAAAIVNSVQNHHGNISLEDLAHYQVKERVAVEADWMGYHLVSMPPPSSGGTHVIQILKFLERDHLTPGDFFKPLTLHRMASAMQQAFVDRARYLGDPDFVKVPVKGLISDDYIRIQHGRFLADQARHQDDVVPGSVSTHESLETSHLSLMDAAGNVVVTTQTVNGWFGSKLVAEGTGIILNNEMDDFSAKPGNQNLFGAVGDKANEIAPGKTPLSSMSPTIVLKNGKPVLAVGAPGGTRIITAVAQAILNYLVFEKSLYDAIAAPRIHHQWTPDVLHVENQPVSPAVLTELDRMGYTIKRVPQQSHVMAVARAPSATGKGDELIGVSDPRDIGTSAGE